MKVSLLIYLLVPSSLLFWSSDDNRDFCFHLSLSHSIISTQIETSSLILSIFVSLKSNCELGIHTKRGFMQIRYLRFIWSIRLIFGYHYNLVLSRLHLLPNDSIKGIIALCILNVIFLVAWYCSPVFQILLALLNKILLNLMFICFLRWFDPSLQAWGFWYVL